MWHFTALTTKIFTMSSIAVGVTLSVLVPLKEYLSMKNAESVAKSTRPALAEQMKMDLDNESVSPGLKAITQKQAELERVDTRSNMLATTLAHDMYIVEYLQGKGYTSLHADLCHKALRATSGVFWVAMLSLLFLWRPECGGRRVWYRHAVFALVTFLSLSTQMWVMLHSRLGYHLAIFQPQRLVVGAVLTVLGHFDTYADVTFAGMLQGCEEITWFSIKERYFHLSYWMHHSGADEFEGARVFQLHVSLQSASLFAIVVGVFLCQALPGFVTLYLGKWFPMAFKINEFNLILSLMDAETVYKDQDMNRIPRSESRDYYELPAYESADLAAVAGAAVLATGTEPVL
eukprot:TRINITY_DN111582_c0_g1_i1.p1 TRINITY_DN111582_c0_g1~~TRINITY_DN111582_c0_g1_i1.p1  ORF type:complete len:346 (+),score=47.26 TRINITY_DN111582_c0_g1_i1:354-1391(+)